MQHRTFDYHAPEDTALLNGRFRGVIPIGVHEGYQAENGNAGFVTIHPGVLVTRDGVRIEEDEPLVDHLSIPPNETADPRLDYVVCRHEYVKTAPAPTALYSIVAGDAAADPEPPIVPDDAVILALGLLPAGATAYSEIRLASPQVFQNARFDGRDFRIVAGAEMAAWWDHDRTQGVIRLFTVDPGTYQNDDVIDWGAPKLTVDGSGHVELNAEAATRQAADAALQANLDTEAAARVAADTAEADARMAADQVLDQAIQDEATARADANAAEAAARKAADNDEAAARSAADQNLQQAISTEASQRAAGDADLQTALGAETNNRTVNDQSLQTALADAKGRAWQQQVPVNQNMAEMAARIGTLETAGGLPGHRSRHEDGGDDIVRFDQLADGTTYKKMLATERSKLAGIETGAEVNNLSDGQANALTGGGNTNLHRHDMRYYTKAAADSQFYAAGSQVADSDRLDGYHASNFAGINHDHDTRYMREVYSDSQYYNAGQQRTLATFGDRPDLVTVVYNYIDSGTNLPEATSYILGARTDELGVWITKIDRGGGDKDYRLFVDNNSSYQLYISVSVFRRDP